MMSTRGRTRYNGRGPNATAGLAKFLYLGLCKLSSVSAAPLFEYIGIEKKKQHEDGPQDAKDASLWLYLGVAAILVLLGGAFAGLTIALMGQDGVYLQVIATSGEGKEQRHAQKVYRLLKRGKHWVLVTLLLSNVIVNETLPIVLDRSLGGGWPAILGSTALIVIFGEVIPQSICVRYGLSIGAFMAPGVWLLMLVLAPIAWPTAKLLDRLLGEDHGTVYKKTGLKTLVALHKTLGSSPTDRLNQDEVTIISAVLDLKDKAVGDIMTPMEDVFTMSADTVLDEDTMNTILSAGYSRIPIYEPGNEMNFVGMLLVKILITYDPEDCKKVSEFSLATLPETRPETSCLDIVNFFQEGKSHMVLVSDYPGENYGATGVVTLEDVIEELIGEEIIDESDVYIDVHKAIRRLAPAPKSRIPKGHIVGNAENGTHECTEDHLIDLREEATSPKRKSASENRSDNPAVVFGTSPKTTFLRRASAGAADSDTIQVRANVIDMREHLKHLGPSNLASRPKTTRYQTVKIKPGLATRLSDSRAISANQDVAVETPYHDLPAPGGGEGEGLLKDAGRDASDGIHALQQGYGSIGASLSAGKSPTFERKQSHSPILESPSADTQNDRQPLLRNGSGKISSRGSSDTVGSRQSYNPKPPRKRGTARSGSITENIIEAGGVRKVVLETNSSTEEGDGSETDFIASGGKGEDSIPNEAVNGGGEVQNSEAVKGDEVKKKRRRTRKKKGGKKESLTTSGSTQDS
ncbi:hypothetical protein B0O99DRAFT_617005 [Bisporella sp. PMI_857]|nr:hypothetical protein B0O99DRAFT_617005 [Bisporella sp. PMI_857]